MRLRHPRLSLTVRALVGVPITGAALTCFSAEPGDPDSLPTIYVSAAAIDEDLSNIAAPVTVLDREALLARTQATLGDMLNGIPGVHSDNFGGGASRPVIRGQTAPRVKVLSDSGSLLDASDVSPDHAVTVEPILIDRVEVLRGPTTLLYGSGAIGGVVNVLDKKVPTARQENGFGGSLAVRRATVSRENVAAVEMTGQATEHLVMHVEGAVREADDYRVPDWDARRVEGTHARSGNGSVGFSWVDDDGYLGLAYSYRDDDYGLPGHNHEYEACHPHGSVLHCGGHGDAEEGHDHDHDHDHDHGEAPTIALLSKRVDLRAEIHQPFRGIERLRLRASRTDYRHDEREEGAVTTTFSNEGYEARIEVQHAPIGRWSGVVGAQYDDTELSAAGEEAFMPVTRTETVGAFIVEHFEPSASWHLELGARRERKKHRPIADARARPRFSDSATSLSAAAIWELVPDYRLTLSVARSERLPHPQELYARGIHYATSTYECGLMPFPSNCGDPEDADEAKVETSRNVELSVRKVAGDLTFDVTLYRNRVDDYLYARTLDRFESFRLIKYSQEDARLKGFEAEATYRLNGNLSATVFGDYVRAELDSRGNLPRIPAARYGTRLDAEFGDVGGQLEYYRVSDQNDIASYEAKTPGYDMLNLTVRYSRESYNLYLRGANLLNEQVWNHSSFLANVVPLPGRSVSVGMELAF